MIDRFANVLPNSARGARVFEGQQGFNFPARDYSARFDWNATDNDTLWARWQYSRQRFQADDIILGERADQNNKQQNYGLTWTHIFNTDLVGEFRYGLGLRTTLVNIAAGNDTPIIRFQNPLPIGGGSIIGNAGAFPIQRYQTDNQFVYNIVLTRGSHIFKAGTDLRFQKLDDLADNFSRGFYTFNQNCDGGSELYGTGFLALINGCVANFQKGYGPFFLENRLGESDFYAEDNWRLRPNLTLNIGVRYEYVNAPRDRHGAIEYGFGDDKDNVEPRVGFAYSPDFNGGFLGSLFGAQGDSSIRGGYGIFHGRLFQSVFSQSGATVRFNPPNAFFYNQSGLGTTLFNPNNLQDPTNGFVFVPGPQTARHAIAIPDPDLQVPYTQQWNLTFERTLPWNSAVRLSYSGNRGIGLPKFTLDNLPIHDPNGVLVVNHPNNPASLRGQIIRPAANIFCAGTGNPGVPINAQCPDAVSIGAFEYSLRVPRTNERRPDPRYSTNILISNGAWSYYHAMQLEYSKNLSQGLNFQAAYTWSRAIDTTSEASFVGAGDSNILGNDSKISRALSRFHTPQRFTFFGTYRLPFFDHDKGVLGQILGGWETSAVFKWAHGTPFTITGTGFDLNLDGFAETRPVLLDPSILGRNIGNPETAQQMLPGTAFAVPTSVNQIDCCLLGRNTFFIDGVKNVDLAFTKRFLMPWEGHSLTVRADLFNAFNKVQFGFPNATYTTVVAGQTRINPSLGILNSLAATYAPRNIQVSLKYYF